MTKSSAESRRRWLGNRKIMEIRLASKQEIQERRAEIRPERPKARTRTQAFKEGQLSLFEQKMWPEAFVENNELSRDLTLEEKRMLGMDFIDWVENGKSVFDFDEDFRKHMLGMKF